MTPVAARGKLDARLVEDLPMFDLDQSKAQILNPEGKRSIGGQGISVLSPTDTLVDVTDKLSQARLQAEGLNDKMFYI
jgi:hypothetical protein